MKLRIVECREHGPHIWDFHSEASLIEDLLFATHRGVSNPSLSVWKKLRGAWVPYSRWQARWSA